jgi:hypothetical protein
MKLTVLGRLALAGLLISLYQLTIAAIPLAQGLFVQDWSRMEVADVPPEIQSPRLMELFHAAHQASHSSAVAFSSLAKMANEMATTQLWGSAVCAVLFAAILFSEVRRSGGRA